MSSNTSRSSSPHASTVADDETFQLALTLMSLPVASRRSVSPPLPLQQDLFSPSSIGSWVGLLPQASISDAVSPSDSNSEDLPTNRPAGRDDRRSTNGVRGGLASLSTPPSPFGSQLGPASSRTAPRTHTQPHQHRRRFNPSRPSQPELSVENDAGLPRPDPDEFYTLLLSAYQSAKDLVDVWAHKAAAVLTDNGRSDWRVLLAKVGLSVVVLCRPRWVLCTVIRSWAVLRDPWRVYHHTFYSVVMGRVLLSL